MTTASPPIDLASLHLARAGQFVDMHGSQVDLTPDLLSALAASYDPAIYQAPLVIGHPQTNSPAFGHLARLEATPDGLFGEPINVDPAFKAAVTSGRYPQRSMSYWPADHPSSPTPGQPYLRHLGVLGATPPAIPGLRGADLASDDAITVEFSSPLAMSTPPMPEPEIIDLAAREAVLATQEANLAAVTAELDRRAAALASSGAGRRPRASCRLSAMALADEARIRPSDIPALAEIMLRLGATEPAPCFAAADPDAAPEPGAWLRGWLASLPPLVELATLADKSRAAAPAVPALNINHIYAARREVQ
jgi:hypothetical protein